MKMKNKIVLCSTVLLTVVTKQSFAEEPQKVWTCTAQCLSVNYNERFIQNFGQMKASSNIDVDTAFSKVLDYCRTKVPYAQLVSQIKFIKNTQDQGSSSYDSKDSNQSTEQRSDSSASSQRRSVGVGVGGGANIIWAFVNARGVSEKYADSYSIKDQSSYKEQSGTSSYYHGVDFRVETQVANFENSCSQTMMKRYREELVITQGTAY